MLKFKWNKITRWRYSFSNWDRLCLEYVEHFWHSRYTKLRLLIISKVNFSSKCVLDHTTTLPAAKMTKMNLFHCFCCSSFISCQFDLLTWSFSSIGHSIRSNHGNKIQFIAWHFGRTSLLCFSDKINRCS